MINSTIQGVQVELPPAVINGGAAEIGMIATGVSLLQNLTTVAAVVWLVGVVLMLVYAVISYLILANKMRNAVLLNANIYEADTVQTPFVLGVFAPKIYLPPDLTESARHYIILHEQTHIRRRDHLVKCAAYIVLSLHWFNPLVWVAFWLMNADMEMSCDEAVLKVLGRNIKSDYSRTLVTLATDWRKCIPTPLAFSEGGVKERIKHIMKYKKASRLVCIIAIVLVVALSLGFAVSQADQPADEVPEASQPADEVPEANLPTGEAPELNQNQPADEAPEADVASELLTPKQTVVNQTIVIAPEPVLEEFRPPVLTIELDPGSEPIVAADTLSPEEAAQIGAKYIWAMLGDSIDGMTVIMSYTNAEWSVRSYWQGTVLDSAPGEYFGRMPFQFKIDAVTGEWLDISNITAIGNLNTGFDLIETEEEWQRFHFTSEYQITLTPEETQLYLEVANEFATRHFQDSRATTFTIQDKTTALALTRDADGNLIATAHKIRVAAIDDDSGRYTMIIELCSQTLQLLYIWSFSDPMPGYVYDGPIGVG